MSQLCVSDWTPGDTQLWLEKEGFEPALIEKLCKEHGVNGKCLLALSESDFAVEPLCTLPLGCRKCLYVAVKTLQRDNHHSLVGMGLTELPNVTMYNAAANYAGKNEYSDCCESDRNSPPGKIGGCEWQLCFRKRSRSLGLVDVGMDYH